MTLQRTHTRAQLQMHSLSVPLMSLEEARKDHGEGTVWVTYKGGVYDMTPFLDAHPGGSSRIEMVSGSDLSAYWNIYEIHNRPHIQALLEEYRVGTLSPEDTQRAEEDAKGTFSNYYQDDPPRPRAEAGDLRVASTAPWNSEPILHKLTETFITPNDLFFTRNHNSVPLVDIDEYTLEIEENSKVGLKNRCFTLDEIKANFPRVEITSALQCAGNRQEDYVTHDRPLFVAPHWRNGAIGCAKWAGVRVRDLLNSCGLDVDGMSLGRVNLPDAKIVNFEGLDTDETGVQYAGVIPIEKAIDPFGDAILAYEMNGVELPRDHGYPLRLLAPGTGGCRNVKWVSKISVTERPSELDSGSKLDRHFSAEIGWSAHRIHTAEDRRPDWTPPVVSRTDNTGEVRLDQGPVIQTLPVQSILTWPPDHSTVSAGDNKIQVKGVAWSGGGRGITRVELSVDGGLNFCAAELIREAKGDVAPEAGMGRNWAWVQFHKELVLPQRIVNRLARGNKAELEICCKAIDGDFNQQPERMSTCWNVLGICVNHWSRLNITLDPTLPKDHVPTAPATPLPGDWQWPE